MARLPLLILSLALTAPMLVAQEAADTGGRRQLETDDIVDRMGQAEKAVLERMKTYQPLMETYLQSVAPDETRGWLPTDDNYFLGQFHYADTPTLRPLSRREPKKRRMVRALGSSTPNLGDAFATMVTPDWRLLERKRYQFKYVRREFLGESRCFVFDVKPLRDGKDGFVGRIWIEDRDYTLVRFNGINHRTDQTLSSLFNRTLSLHVDAWRVNVAPGVWVPSYVYSEETDLDGAASAQQRARFKSQTRIWGYQAQGPDSSGSLTSIRIDEPNVADTSDAAAQLSPVLSGRRWEQEAEANVLERPLRCRILLTSPLESFTIGHTIVLSRGLVDVLPDEASLATMLAHELSHALLGHALIDTKFAFADRLMIGDGELLQVLQFHRMPREEAAADDKVIELLGKSPYRDKLGDAGLFLRAVSDQAKQLPHLIRPHIGDYLAANGQTRLAELMQKAPALMPDNLEQVAALQLGARLVVDPWSGKLALDRTPAVALTSVREKVPFAVTPVMPVIRYAAAPDAGAPVRTVGELR
jgi:hypothetical protein